MYNYFEFSSTFVSLFKESQSIEQDEVGEKTQDTASENQDSFEETPQVFASQTSTEKSAAPPSHGSLAVRRESICKSQKKTNLTLLADLWPLD